jgi:hypothetical protein
LRNESVEFRMKNEEWRIVSKVQRLGTWSIEKKQINIAVYEC